jgi:hypothetical protein
MDTNTPDQQPGPSETRTEPPDWREERRLRREERRAARGSGGAWVGGAILILVGIVLMLNNLGTLALENWWALFILIPAVGAFGNAWRAYQAAGGHLNAQARGSLIGGLVLTMVAAVFLFNLNWGIAGPVLLILGGVGLLLNAFLP